MFSTYSKSRNSKNFNLRPYAARTFLPPNFFYPYSNPGIIVATSATLEIQQSNLSLLNSVIKSLVMTISVSFMAGFKNGILVYAEDKS